MIALLAILAPISLLDSTSMVPISIVPITTILAGRRALSGAIAFIAGIFVTYAAVGVLAVMGLDAVFTRLNAEFTRAWKHPDTLDFALQIVIGVVLIVIGQRMANARRSKERVAPPDVTPWQAFTFASGLVIVGLPGAIPYFAAVDQMLQADLSAPQTVLAVLFYNLIFVAPLVAIVVIRQLMGTRADGLLAAITRFMETWGRRV
ncbi:MAG: GAP family protein, partial [Candidatus Krumholzibacteria bacterium]|nr:GAP family protein [Candidatus Krumholzibacteria bacterium]